MANRLEFEGDGYYFSVFFSSFLLSVAFPIKDDLGSFMIGTTISAGLLEKKASKERIPLWLVPFFDL